MPLTLATAQAFVAKLAADLAAQVERQSPVLMAATRNHQQTVVNPFGQMAVNLTDRTGALLTQVATNRNAMTATLAIQRLLDDPVFYQSTLETLAQLQCDEWEALLLGQNGAFTSNTALGAASTSITQATLDAAVSVLLGRNPPPGDPIYLVLSSVIPSGAASLSAHQEVLALAGIQDQTRVGIGIVTSVNVNYRAPRYRGMNILRSAFVQLDGSTRNNFAFLSSALALTTVRMGLTNDATNVQAYSETARMGFRVALAFESANDNQAVTITSRGNATTGRTEYGVRVRS